MSMYDENKSSILSTKMGYPTKYDLNASFFNIHTCICFVALKKVQDKPNSAAIPSNLPVKLSEKMLIINSNFQVQKQSIWSLLSHFYFLRIFLAFRSGSAYLFGPTNVKYHFQFWKYICIFYFQFSLILVFLGPLGLFLWLVSGSKPFSGPTNFD